MGLMWAALMILGNALASGLSQTGAEVAALYRRDQFPVNVTSNHLYTTIKGKVMKALSLLLLRLSTGGLLVWWGVLRLLKPATGPSLSGKYYGNLLNDETSQLILGGAEVALGALIILGLLRIVVYPIQAIFLGVSTIFIWKHLVDPLSLFLWAEGERANLLFYPSSTVFFATLVLLAFHEYDDLSLDKLFRR